MHESCLLLLKSSRACMHHFFPLPIQFSYFYVLFFMVIKLDQKLAKEFCLFERTGEDMEVDACRYYNEENLEKGMDRVV